MENQERENVIELLTRSLIDQGKLIEAGWLTFKEYVLPKNASEVQVSEMRKAFFAGNQHMFGSIMTMLEPGKEATDTDCQRMEKISIELNAFVHSLKEVK